MSGHSAEVDVVLLSDDDMASIAPLGAFRRGPYGSFVTPDEKDGVLPASGLGDWLICIEHDKSRLLAFDCNTKIALLWFARNPPPRELAEFCRPLLHWLAIGDGNVIIHAAAIAHDGRAVLVAGDGNAGKTTLVRACLAAGLDYLGDNVVEVSLAQGTGNDAHVWGAYPSLKVRQGSPDFEGLTLPAPLWDDEARKEIYFLGKSTTLAFQPRPVLHVATLVLHETAAPRLAVATAASTFFSMAPNTVAQFPFYSAEVLERVRRVSQQAATYSAGRLDLGAIADHVRSLLA